MTRAFNIEGLVRLQNYMGGKTLSDAQFFAVLNADVVEMIDGEESTTKRRYSRIAENDESITFSCILGLSQQQMVVTKATKQLDVTTTEISGAIAPGSITTEMLATGAVTSAKLAPGLDVSGLFFILPEDTQFPYTLTEADKTKLANARFLVCVGPDGSIVSASHPVNPSHVGAWLGLHSASLFSKIVVTESTINAPSSLAIYDGNAVKYNIAQTLTAKQKAQARANIESADAGLFFIPPEGTQFPYTLTEEDKTKLANARFLIIKDDLGVSVFTPSRLVDTLDGFWFSTRNQYLFSKVNIANGILAKPENAYIEDASAVHFTYKQTLSTAQKALARANIGAAEDPNTSGDSPATLEEPMP